MSFSYEDLEIEQILALLKAEKTEFQDLEIPVYGHALLFSPHIITESSQGEFTYTTPQTLSVSITVPADDATVSATTMTGTASDGDSESIADDIFWHLAQKYQFGVTPVMNGTAGTEAKSTLSAIDADASTDIGSTSGVAIYDIIDISAMAHWKPAKYSTAYDVQLYDSDDEAISGKSWTVETPILEITGLESGTTYKLGVTPKKGTNSGTEVFSSQFTTSDDPVTFIGTNETETSIPDNDTDGATLSITCGDADLTISRITIRVTITHPYISDLKIELTDPDDDTITLQDRLGGDQALNNDTVEFNSDENEDLAGLIGNDPEGDWDLKISDLSEVDAGTIHSWELDIEYSQTAPTLGTLAAADIILEKSTDTTTAKWKPVQHATSYAVKIYDVDGTAISSHTVTAPEITAAALPKSILLGIGGSITPSIPEGDHTVTARVSTDDGAIATDTHDFTYDTT